MIEEFIAQLKVKDIRLAVNGGRLKVNAPAGAMTPEMLASLKTHKAAILAALATQSGCIAVSPPDPPSAPPSVTKPPAWPATWFIAGGLAPRRDTFPTSDGTVLTDGTRGPDWIDYTYELHNRRLIVVNGWIMRDAEEVLTYQLPVRRVADNCEKMPHGAP